MRTVTTHYSHAAPYIRRRLIDEVASTLHATTQRDRRAGWKAVGAYAMALGILADAADQTPVEGIPDVDSIPIDALRETLRYFGVLTPEGERKPGDWSAAVETLSADGVDAMLARLDRFNEIQSRSRGTH